MGEGKGFVVKGKKDEDYDDQYQHQAQRSEGFEAWNLTPELRNFGGVSGKEEYRFVEWKTNVDHYPLKVISKISYCNISDEEWQSIFTGLLIRFEGDVAALEACVKNDSVGIEAFCAQSIRYLFFVC